MKLSIITPVYRVTKALEKFLEKMEHQTSKDFEIVIVLDTNTDKALELIQKHTKKLGKKVKLIFNSKRTSRTMAIRLGAKHASGKYSVIMSSHNSFDNSFVKNALMTIKEKKTDIIEFRAKFASPIKFDGKIRKPYMNSTLISENPEIHAFTYPVDFNKFFKTEVLIQSSKYKLPGQLNSRYSIDATYLSLLVAKTYSTTNKVFITAKSKISESFNPLKMIRQWETLFKLINDFTSLETTDRYVYAQYFAEVVFMAPLIKVSKNKVLMKKFEDKFKKQQQDIFKTIFDDNKYANTSAKEYKILSNNTKVSELTRIHKELG